MSFRRGDLTNLAIHFFWDGRTNQQVMGQGKHGNQFCSSFMATCFMVIQVLSILSKSLCPRKWKWKSDEFGIACAHPAHCAPCLSRIENMALLNSQAS
jgi:hypothetical protein